MKPNDPLDAIDEWQPASGEIVRLARQLRARQSRRQWLAASGGVAGSLLAVAGGWWLIRANGAPHEFDFAGITCSEVAARVPALKQGRLPADELAQIKQHVELCAACKANFEQMDALKLLG